MTTALVTLLSAILPVLLVQGASPPVNGLHRHLALSLPQLQSLSLSLVHQTPPERTTTHIAPDYYGETLKVGVGTVVGDQQSSHPDHPRRFAVTGHYEDYHPSDQVLTCFHIAHEVAGIPDRLPVDPISTLDSITIPPAALPAFLPCCPTIHTPTTDEGWLRQVELVLGYPFAGPNSNLNKVGCGHSQTLIPNTTVPSDHYPSTGLQSDPYPRLIDKFGYRNTPNPWYYSSGSGRSPRVGPNADVHRVLTYAEFSLPSAAIQQSPRISYRSKSMPPNDQRAPPAHPLITPVECKSRSMSQTGEGYHRQISFGFDPKTCSLLTQPQQPQSTDLKSSTKLQPAPLVPQPNCSYLALYHLPNSIFVDPYQISYAALALHRQAERSTAQPAPDMHTSDTHIRATTVLTQSTSADWFLSDFIDVEAQMNNAVGNNLLVKFPTSALGEDGPHEVHVPIHLRYAPGQFRPTETSQQGTPSSSASIATDELRFQSRLAEPQLYLYCPAPHASAILPPLKDLWDLRQEIHNGPNPSLPPLVLTVPVGSLILYPVAMLGTFAVMITTAVLFHLVVLTKWFDSTAPGTETKTKDKQE